MLEFHKHITNTEDPQRKAATTSAKPYHHQLPQTPYTSVPEITNITILLKKAILDPPLHIYMKSTN